MKKKHKKRTCYYPSCSFSVRIKKWKNIKLEKEDFEDEDFEESEYEDFEDVLNKKK